MPHRDLCFHKRAEAQCGETLNGARCGIPVTQECARVEQERDEIGTWRIFQRFPTSKERPFIMNAKYLRAITFAVGVCLVLGVLGAFACPRDTQAHRNTSDFNAVDDYITARMEAARIPGLSVAIVKGDQIVYLKGYGQADPSGRSVTPQTPFITGSISKTFTALAVMQLVEDGKVDLDAAVQRYLPWFRVADPRASAQITVRSLLNHTSGLPQVTDTFLWTDQDAGVLERTVRYLQTVALARPIGTFGYSNANYQIQGLIVQTVSGQSYEAYVEQHIFAPLAMQTSFTSQQQAQQHGMATGYRWWFGFPIPATLPFLRAELPAGFLLSSAQDMAHYLIAMMNGGRYQGRSILSPQGIAFLWAQSPGGSSYGNGWEVAALHGRTLVNLDGATANFQASVFFDPEERVGVFVAANVMNALDGLSSPPHAATFASITTRGIAQSVLSLTTNQSLPDQGLGIERISLIYGLLVLALTGVLVLALARMPQRYRRLAQRGLAKWSDLARRSGWITALHFAWPGALLYVALTVPEWKELVWFQPDLTYWLSAVAMLVTLKGGVELMLVWRVWRVFGQKHRSQMPQQGALKESV
jgi:CubicO group peptidase (beta-lactamase class C family)